MTKSSENVRRMVLCAMFTALVAVCSQIAVPMPWGVPINLALFAVYMAGTMLGPVWGTASQVVFIALAAIGVPVLANFQGGPSAIFGKTGGYAIGYILTALLTALLTKALGRKFWSLCVAMVVGCAACIFPFIGKADLINVIDFLQDFDSRIGDLCTDAVTRDDNDVFGHGIFLLIK